MRFGTTLIHNGHDFDRETGALGVPVYQTSTFHQADMDVSQEYDYSRSGNPTRKALEDAIALLECGACGYAFASGIAAVALALGIFSAGDHIIAAEDIYGGSYRLLNDFFKRWGLEHTAVDAANIDAIKAAIKPNTKALFLETPSNPLLKITDLKPCFNFARERGLISIVDNTFMTPYLQRPLELGGDIVIHSATKFLGGHSDVIFGLVVTKTEELGRRVYRVQNSFGAVPGPWDIFLVLRGLKTLKVRMDESEKTARKLALFLREHKNVNAVYYPALEGHQGREVHAKQASGGGAVLSFKADTPERARRFLKNVRLAACAVSLGGVETIASYPVRMSHAAIPPAERARLGITDTLIRISCGLEDADDLIEDFENALRAPV